MRITRLTKIAMVIFLSMIFFLGVQRPVLAADRNTTVKIPVEQIFEVNNSADADKTGSYVLIADQIQNPMPEGSTKAFKKHPINAINSVPAIIPITALFLLFFFW